MCYIIPALDGQIESPSVPFIISKALVLDNAEDDGIPIIKAQK